VSLPESGTRTTRWHWWTPRQTGTNILLFVSNRIRHILFIWCIRDEDYTLALVDAACNKAIEIQLVRKVSRTLNPKP
jgi:hypothetical protein